MSTDQVGGKSPVAKDHPASWTLKQPCPALACWLGNSQGRDAPDPACPLPWQPPHAGGLHKSWIPYIAGSPGGVGVGVGVAGAWTLRILLSQKPVRAAHFYPSVSAPPDLRLSSSALVDSGVGQIRGAMGKSEGGSNQSVESDVSLHLRLCGWAARSLNYRQTLLSIRA